MNRMMVSLSFYLATSSAFGHGMILPIDRAASVPLAVKAAFKQTHQIAARSDVRNLYMFNYVYYAKGLCKDQDCSESYVNSQMSAARAKLGDDFQKYSQFTEQYATAIANLQAHLAKGDLTSINGARTYLQDQQFGIFVSCIDFAKSVMGAAIDLGFPKDEIKIYVTMAEDGYKIMCPATDGRKPILPRPVVHTLIAYLHDKQWFALNVEDPQALPIPLGTSLPGRLQHEHQFTFPALIAYQKLVLAGTYPADAFTKGFPYNWLVSMTASGLLQSDPNSVSCL